MLWNHLDVNHVSVMASGFRVESRTFEVKNAGSFKILCFLFGDYEETVSVSSLGVFENSV